MMPFARSLRRCRQDARDDPLYQITYHNVTALLQVIKSFLTKRFPSTPQPPHLNARSLPNTKGQTKAKTNLTNPLSIPSIIFILVHEHTC